MPDETSVTPDADGPTDGSASASGVRLSPTAALAAIGGIVLVAVALALLLQGDDDPSAVPTAPSTSVVDEPGARETEAIGNRPEVPPIDCLGLWGDDELVLALGSEDRPFAELDSLRFGRSEICTESLVSDESYFIRLEPGDPIDFAEGALLNGTTGAPLAAVGEQALLFDDDGDGVALLAVFGRATVGELFFRVSIGRPDLGPDERAEVIAELGRRILAKFPYVEPAPAEAVTLEFGRAVAPDDPGPPGFDDLVLAGIEEGVWDEGDGIVAALRLIAGEESDLDPPADVDVLSGSTSGVTLMALDYLENGSDDVAKAEIERLLPDASLEPAATGRDAALDRPDDEGAAAAGSGIVLAAYQEDPPEQVETPVEEESQDVECFTGPSYSDDVCLTVEPIGPVNFAYPVEALEGSVAGWTNDHIELVRAAIERSVETYTGYGALTEVTLLLSAFEEGISGVVPQPVDGECATFLHKRFQIQPTDAQRFAVAMELAGCFLWRNLPREVFRSYSAAKWWYQGMVVHLAAEVYPEDDLEWGGLVTVLEQSELTTSLQNRKAASNWVFFRSVAANGGSPVAGLGLIASLTDAPTIQAQQDKLAANSASEPALHVFHQELSDSWIPEPGGAPRTYQPPAWELELSGPSVVIDEPIRFGVTRVHVTVPTGMYACLEYDISDFVITSWRSGAPGEGGSWTFEIPEEITGESLFVATTVEEGESFGFSAEVGDEPGCDDEDDVDDVELPDCGICDPSFFYRVFGAFAAAVGG